MHHYVSHIGPLSHCIKVDIGESSLVPSVEEPKTSTHAIVDVPFLFIIIIIFLIHSVLCVCVIRQEVCVVFSAYYI